MKVLIDTNVIMDVLLARQPHFEFSQKCVKICGERHIGHLTVTQTKDFGTSPVAAILPEDFLVQNLNKE